MIRAPGLDIPPQDPKLKLPPIGSTPARSAADAGEIAALRKRAAAAETALAALTARVAALEVNAHVPVDFTPMLDRIAALEAIASHQTAIGETQKPTRIARETKAGETRAGKSQSQESHSYADLKPWIAAGVSRSTWFRHQKSPANNRKTID